MIYHFMHYFETPTGPYYPFPLSDEKKLEIAKRKAADQLAEKLLENSVFKVNEQGNVEGYFEI